MELELIQLCEIFEAYLTVDESNEYMRWAFTNEEIQKYIKLNERLSGLELIVKNPSVNVVDCMNTRDMILEELRKQRVVVFDTLKQWYDEIVDKRTDNVSKIKNL